MTEHDYVEFWHCADCVTRCIKQSAPLTGCGKERDGKVCGREQVSGERPLTDDEKRHAAIGIAIEEAERMHSLFQFDQFGTLKRERIKILFVGQDDWEHEAELPAVPRVGDEVFFWLENAVHESTVTTVYWTLFPNKYQVTVCVELGRSVL